MNMVRTIVTDPLILRIKSVPASKDDLPAAQDLLDTIHANAAACVGMAANMIGVHKCIMAVLIGNRYELLINPEITSYSGAPYIAEEGCLSLQGVRKANRYPVITVVYCDTKFHKKVRTFRGFTAQIVQHELDHFEGVLI